VIWDAPGRPRDRRGDRALVTRPGTAYANNRPSRPRVRGGWLTPATWRPGDATSTWTMWAAKTDMIILRRAEERPPGPGRGGCCNEHPGVSDCAVVGMPTRAFSLFLGVGGRLRSRGRRRHDAEECDKSTARPIHVAATSGRAYRFFPADDGHGTGKRGTTKSRDGLERRRRRRPPRPA